MVSEKKTTSESNTEHRKFGIARFIGRSAALLVSLSAPLSVTAAAYAGGVARDFSIRYQTNQPGAIRIVGNSTMTCSNASNSLIGVARDGSGATTTLANPFCADARNRTGATTPAGDPSNINDAEYMIYTDIDGDGSTFSSSSSSFTLPNNATITFAGLYWSGITDVVTTRRYVGSNNAFDFFIPGGQAAPNAGIRNQVKFKVGNGVYQTLSATQLDTDAQGTAGGTGGIYQGFIDVTNLVAGQASGSAVNYTVADVQSAQGQKGYGSWSLVVVYEKTDDPLRNLTVYDGLIRQQNGDGPRSTTVSGFFTPITGPIRAEAGIVVYEGDLDIPGDQFLFNGAATSDALNPINEFWNSNTTLFGAELAGRNPSFTNLFGTDINMLNVSNFVTNGDNSADIGFTTVGDQYYPGVFTFAIDIFRPELTRSFTKRAKDLNGGDYLPGEDIEYEISYTNTGNDGAADVVLTDPIPTGSDFVAGSIEVVADPEVANIGSKTDTVGDDEGDFDSGNNQLVIRTGVGANGTQGGLVDIGETVTVRFKVKIDPNFSTPNDLSNQASIDYSSGTTSEPFSGDSDNPDTPEEGDSTIITVSDPPPVAGLVLLKRITAINRGLSDEQDFGLEYVDVGGPDDGDNNENWPGASVSATIGGGTVESYVAGIVDGAASNARVQPGDEVEYSIPFLSDGNATAVNVSICDRIPTNTTFLETAYNTLPPSSSDNRGILLEFNGSQIALTNVDDGDETPAAADSETIGGYYFPAGVDPSTRFPNVNCGGTNDNGAIVVELGDVPNATGDGVPANSYGLIRFKAVVN